MPAIFSWFFLVIFTFTLDSTMVLKIYFACASVGVVGLLLVSFWPKPYTEISAHITALCLAAGFFTAGQAALNPLTWGPLTIAIVYLVPYSSKNIQYMIDHGLGSRNGT